jgi:predicted transcriptional regulator
MRTVKKKDTKEKKWTRPGTKLTHEEFMAGIKKAEKGPFYTLEESERHFEKWKEKYLKERSDVMRTKIIQSGKNMQVLGEPLPDKELAKLVKEAETGPFYSFEEMKQILLQWRKERKSL